MSWDWGKFIRSTSLVILMASAAVFCGLCWFAVSQKSYMIIPAVGFTGVYIWFIGVEIWGALTGYKKTLSTRWKHWATEYPTLSWVALGLFWVAMTALVIHLGVYW